MAHGVRSDHRDDESITMFAHHLKQSMHQPDMVAKNKKGLSLKGHSLWQTAKQNKHKNVEIPWQKNTWGTFVRGPLWNGEKKQKQMRGVYRVNPGVFGRP